MPYLHYKSMSELRAMARGHFFHPDTMKHWGSTVYTQVRTGSTGWFFITSEGRAYAWMPRLFKVRKMDEVGNVSTIGEPHVTFEEALEAATEAARKDKEENEGP